MVNDIPKWARGYLRPDRVRLIEEAVAEAESKTSGEIVPMIVRRSSTVGHVPVIVLCVLVILFLLFDGPTHQARWLGAHWAWYLADVFVVLAISSFLSRWSFVQRILTSRDDQELQVNLRAEVEFYESDTAKTRGATGVLLFVSLMERRAVVLADKAIAEKLPTETWSTVCSLLVDGIKQKHIGLAFRDAILHCGKMLAPLFPIRPDDVDELKNQLILKE